MASNLNTIEGRFAEQPLLEQLLHLVQAGCLPNLKRLHLGMTPTNANNITRWTKGVLNPYIERMNLLPEPSSPVHSLSFVHALHRGEFPQMKYLCIISMHETTLQLLLQLLV
jgi:hypothetical protein